MKKRSEIENKYKWDLTKFCKDDKTFYKNLKEIESKISSLKKYEGKLSDVVQMYNCLEEECELSKEISLIAEYAFLRLCEDNGNRVANEMNEKLSFVLSKLSSATAFIDVEISQLDDKVLEGEMKNRYFTQYSRYFEGILREKAHTLSKQEEQLLSQLSECLGGDSTNFDKFSDVDLKFDNILDEKGNKHELNQSNFSLFRESSDRVLRLNAYKEMLGKYGQFINFLSSNYINNVKEDCVFAKLRKYKSALSASIYNEEASEDVYNLLIKKVHDNIDVMYEYFEIKRKMLGLNKFAVYDNFAPVVKGVSKKFSFEEAIETIKEATSVLGTFYSETIDKAVKERWIDVFPNENKDSGAFSSGVYGATPVVLTNFEGNLESVFTLAHELGHAIHTYRSNLAQPYQKSDYVIFVAEVASTVNEMLLLRHLLKCAKTREEIIYYYDHFLNQVKSTIFRQTMFAEFEQFVHEEYEKERPLTAELLCEKYKNLNDFYFGDKVEQIEEMKYEWARIPHFYRSFYVYKYAIGLICAIKISDKLMSDVDGQTIRYYLQFLSSGCSQDPISLLKIAGCDLNDKKTFDDAFKVCRDFLVDWKNLM